MQMNHLNSNIDNEKNGKNSSLGCSSIFFFTDCFSLRLTHFTLYFIGKMDPFNWSIVEGVYLDRIGINWNIVFNGITYNSVSLSAINRTSNSRIRSVNGR